MQSVRYISYTTINTATCFSTNVPFSGSYITKEYKNNRYYTVHVKMFKMFEM